MQSTSEIDRFTFPQLAIMFVRVLPLIAENIHTHENREQSWGQPSWNKYQGSVGNVICTQLYHIFWIEFYLNRMRQILDRLFRPFAVGRPLANQLKKWTTPFG